MTADFFIYENRVVTQLHNVKFCRRACFLKNYFRKFVKRNRRLVNTAKNKISAN